MPETTRKIERSPKGYAKVHADGMQAMVDIEDDGLRHARAVVAAVTARYATRKQSDYDARRNAAAAALLLFGGVSGSLLTARRKAAMAAQSFTTGELDVALGLVGSKKQTAPTATAISEEERIRRSVEETRRALSAMGQAGPYRGAAASKARADAAARGYVKTWRQKFNEYVESRSARGSNVSFAFEDAAAAVDHKIVTATATEVSQAFNAEHRSMVSDFLKRPGVDVSSWFLRWDATLDNRTCGYCSDMHGKTVPAKQGFGGSSPGSVHPRCRCQEQLVWMPS